MQNDDPAVGVSPATTPVFDDGSGPDDILSAAGPTDSGVPAGYSVVRFPDGSLRMVPDSAIVDATTMPETAVSEAVKGKAEPEPELHFYVHLANGDIRRVKESDLPGPAGTNALYGHWVEGGKCHTVIGVHPVETDAK